MTDISVPNKTVIINVGRYQEFRDIKIYKEVEVISMLNEV
jgi:hypothetical protein